MNLSFLGLLLLRLQGATWGQILRDGAIGVVVLAIVTVVLAALVPDASVPPPCHC